MKTLQEAKTSRSKKMGVEAAPKKNQMTNLTLKKTTTKQEPITKKMIRKEKGNGSRKRLHLIITIENSLLR
jgi:hypothetical protein